MYQVVLPVDSSEERTRAQVDAATSLPHATDSVRAVVLHVFDDEETAESTSVKQTVTGRLAVDELQSAGVDVESRSTFGDPDSEIVAVAEEVDADMILLGGRKRSPLGALVFGSVSQAVVLDSDRPVAITGSASAEAE